MKKIIVLIHKILSFQTSEVFMKKIIIILTIFLSQFLFSATKNNVWQNFVKNPSDLNFKLCKKQLKKEKKIFVKRPHFVKKAKKLKDMQLTKTQKELFLDFSTLEKFINLIKSGNKNAMNLGFDVYKESFGFFIDYLVESIGYSMKKNPELFLKLFKKNVSKKQYNSYLLDSIAPFELDDSKIQLQEIKERITALKTVKTPKLQYLKNTFLEILKNHKKIILKFNKTDLERDELCKNILENPDNFENYLKSNTEKLYNHFIKENNNFVYCFKVPFSQTNLETFLENRGCLYDVQDLNPKQKKLLIKIKKDLNNNFYFVNNLFSNNNRFFRMWVVSFEFNPKRFLRIGALKLLISKKEVEKTIVWSFLYFNIKSFRSAYHRLKIFKKNPEEQKFFKIFREDLENLYFEDTLKKLFKYKFSLCTKKFLLLFDFY